MRRNATLLFLIGSIIINYYNFTLNTQYYTGNFRNTKENSWKIDQYQRTCFLTLHF